MTLDRFAEVFVRSFCRVKSRTYPYVGTQVEPGLWIMKDDPPRPDARKTEIISVNLGADRAIELVGQHHEGWHFLCELHHASVDFKSVRATYKARGYRALSTEWLFVHDLSELPPPPKHFVHKFDSKEEFEKLIQTVGQPRNFLEGTTKFAIHTGEQEIGFVTDVPCAPDAWVSDLWVRESERRKGYGFALMSALLHHVHDRGNENSVLIASKAGAELYPLLGYKQIGVLQMFVPAKR